MFMYHDHVPFSDEKDRARPEGAERSLSPKTRSGVVSPNRNIVRRR